MNDRFLVPTAVAAALHAFLFFGFPTERPPMIGGDPEPPSKPVIPPTVIEITLPLDTESPENPAVSQGNPAEPRPELPEPPMRDSLEITMPHETPLVGPVEPINKIPVGPPGDPNGTIGPRISGHLTPGQLDNVPRTRSQLAPVYPYEARKAGRPGEVVVEFVVDEAGHVLDPHVLRSNDPIFDAPTLRAVSKWRFEPGRKNGRIVRFRMAVPVAFAIND